MKIRHIIILTSALTLVVGLVWFDFYVWRALHPTAPGWMFIFSK